VRDNCGSGHEPSASNRNDDRIERIRVLEELQRRGARARDDSLVIKRWDERRATLGGEGLRNLFAGASVGMTIVAGMPRSRAASATPCA
jgi:hypothetical protein